MPLHRKICPPDPQPVAGPDAVPAPAFAADDPADDAVPSIEFDDSFAKLFDDDDAA